MVLFAILAIILFILVIALVVSVSIFGAGAILVFADVIVCIGIIVLIMYKIINRKR